MNLARYSFLPYGLTYLFKSAKINLQLDIANQERGFYMDQDNKHFWSRWAYLYDKFMSGNQSTYDQIAEKMKRRLNRQMEVLELACGTGLLSKQIAHSVRHLEATDFSPEMIAKAKQKGESSRLHFCVQDATDLSFPDASFDAVVISNALHIMPQPDKAMAQIRRVLKPGGLLIAPTFVHGEGMGFRLRTKILELGGFKAYHKWNAEELAAYIADNGFTVTKREILGSNVAPLCYLEAIQTNTDF